MTPIDRFRNGWIEDDETRSQPLALSKDWKEVGFWPTQDTGATEKAILKRILADRTSAFALRGRIMREIIEIDPKGVDANDKGINEIRRIDVETIPKLRRLMLERGINDPLAERVLRHVFRFINHLMLEGIHPLEPIPTRMYKISPNL